MHPPSFIVSLFSSPSLSSPAAVSRSRWVICPSLTSTCLPNPHRSLFSRGRLWQLPVAHCVCASHLISVSVSQTIGILNVKGSFVFFCESNDECACREGEGRGPVKGWFCVNADCDTETVCRDKRAVCGDRLGSVYGGQCSPERRRGRRVSGWGFACFLEVSWKHFLGLGPTECLLCCVTPPAPPSPSPPSTSWVVCKLVSFSRTSKSSLSFHGLEQIGHGAGAGLRVCRWI